MHNRKVLRIFGEDQREDQPLGFEMLRWNAQAGQIV